MMRRLYILTGLCVLMGMFTACSEDKGNYDYRPLNAVTIEGVD